MHNWRFPTSPRAMDFPSTIALTFQIKLPRQLKVLLEKLFSSFFQRYPGNLRKILLKIRAQCTQAPHAKPWRSVRNGRVFHDTPRALLSISKNRRVLPGTVRLSGSLWPLTAISGIAG